MTILKTLRSKISLFLFVTLISFFGCSHNSSIENYPRLTDKIRSDFEELKGKSKDNLKGNVPDLRSRYKFMAPGHKFKISHPSDKKLSGIYTVNTKGILRLPYDVSINVNDKTFSEVKKDILDAYSVFFERGVGKVYVTLYNRDYYVEVGGLVNKPGRYLMSYGDSVDILINKAGGLVGSIVEDYYTADIKQLADDYQVLLNNYYDSNKESERIYWTGYDKVFVSKLDALTGSNDAVSLVTVLGGVARPGKLLYEEGASLFYFLDKSGGTIPGIDYEECYIFRKTKDGLKKIAFNLGQTETIPVIFPNDIIYLNTQVLSKEDKFLSRLVQIGSLLSTIALLILAL